MGRRVVVIGGSAAGMSAASVAKRGDPDLVVTVLERTGAISYSACGIPYRLGGEVETPMEELVALTPEEALSQKGVDVRVHTEATGVDMKRREVAWKELDSGETGKEAFDELVLAMGTRTREVVPLAPRQGVFPLRTLDDGVALERWLQERAPRKAVVIGAGFIGIEAAEALTARGVPVALVNRRKHVLPSMLDESMAAPVVAALKEAKVRFVAGAHATGWKDEAGGVHALEEPEKEEATGVGATRPGTGGKHKQAPAKRKATKKSAKKGSSERHSGAQKNAEGDAARVSAVLVGGKELPADVVIVAAGVRPASELAVQAGCTVREDGAVVVDPLMRTGVEGVWACGDCVTFPHQITGKGVLLPLALHANRSGRIAGQNMAGGEARFPGVLGTAITRFKGLEIACTGFTESAATRAGFDVVTGQARVATRAEYMPGAGEATVRMIAERTTGRLLGVQMVGPAGTALRIDAAAALVWKEATLEETEAMDFAYNPPFSPVWDPLAIAARVTEKNRAPGL